MIKSKSLHSIPIFNWYFSTRLYYNINTNHITINTSHKYQDPNEAKEYAKEYYKNNKNYSKEYYKNNKNKFKKYQENNKEKINEYHKEYYENNKIKMEKYRKDNKEKINEYTKKYHEDNKEKLKEKRENNRNPNITIQGSEEHKIQCSCIMRGIPIEDFDGFITNLPYCYKFNESCKESNREKYNRRCFICDKNEFENGQRLSVHHIDMSKSQGCNGEVWKLVPLCKSCHSRSHNNLWQSRIEYLLNIE